MPEKYYILDFDTATDALRVLAEFVDAGGAPPDAARVAALGKLYLAAEQPDSEAYEAQAWAYWPVTPRRGSDRQWEALEAVYKRLTGKGTGRSLYPDDPFPAAAQPATVGLATLLAYSGAPDSAPAPATQQRLLVVPDLSLEESADWFHVLQLLATQVRTARHEATGRVYQFYWFVDDRGRDSLAKYLPPDYLTQGRLLAGFADRPVGRAAMVFVPNDRVPGQAALEAYGRLLSAAPGLFGLGDAPPTPEVLAAIVPTGGDDAAARHLHLYLGHTRFYSDWAIAPRRELGTIDVAGLADTPRAMDQLKDALNTAQPRLGYRLRLARSRYTGADQEHNQVLIERLEYQRLAIEQSIADLEGFKKERPRLLRFRPEQLPAMADILRFFPAQELPQLLYGFHARPDDGAGAHFLFIPHRYQHHFETDPLLSWTLAKGPTLDFWLEPNWTRDYWGQNHHMVFVPRGRTLTPPLHSWAVDSMDGYLRQMVEALPRAASRSATPLPATPLYLFDGQEERIDVTVLDYAAFQPLRTSLPWLNDNLRLIETWGGARKFIEELSDEAGRAQLALQSKANAAQATRELDTLIDATDAQAAAGLGGLLHTLTEEIGSLANEGEDLVNKARALNTELEAIKAFHAATQAEVRQTRQAIDQTTGAEVERLVAYYRGLAEGVESAIAQSQHARDTLGRRIDNAVAELQATGQRLRQRLDALRREGW